MPPLEFLKRHLGHMHGANKKYGYLIFFVADLLYPLYLWLIQKVYHQKWAQTGRSRSSLRLVSMPLPVKILIWICLTVLVAFWDLHTGDEFITHVKRLGRISYVLIPLDIFLALRPSPLPLNHYLDLLVLHKWVSRIILVTGLLHGLGFFVKWIREGALFKAVRLLNFLGVVDSLLFLVLLVISIRPLRRLWYRFFYVFHMLTVWTTTVAIAFHARPGVTFYAVTCVLLLVYGVVHRARTSTNLARVQTKRPDGASLAVVTLAKTLVPLVFSPASHVRVAAPLASVALWLYPSHPYTIASMPHDNDVKLIVAPSAFRFDETQQYSLSGPYELLPLNFFQTAENVCLVCGGAGISLGLPLYHHFKKNSADVKLVWATRNRRDLYLLKEFNVKGIEIFVTGPGSGAGSGYETDPDAESGELLVADADNDLSEFLINDSDSDVDLRNSLDSFDIALNPFNDPKTGLLNDRNVIHYGSRPELGACFKKSLARTADNANKWVIACGNESLVADARRFSKSQGTRFFAEVYLM